MLDKYRAGHAKPPNLDNVLAGFKTPRSLCDPLNTLAFTYSAVARSSWSTYEIANRYQAAYLRGESDLPPDQPPPDRPIGLLATAIPRMISLAAAANVLHVLLPG